jgi:hypothetical protein
MHFHNPVNKSKDAAKGDDYFKKLTEVESPTLMDACSTYRSNTVRDKRMELNSSPAG